MITERLNLVVQLRLDQEANRSTVGSPQIPKRREVTLEYRYLSKNCQLDDKRCDLPQHCWGMKCLLLSEKSSTSDTTK